MWHTVWLEQLLRKNPVPGVGEDRTPSSESLTCCPPVLAESLSGSWKEGAPSSSSSSGYWSWSAPSDQSNPSTPSPPLSADSFKPFRSPAPPDDGIDEADASNLLFDEPIPRKRKVSGPCTVLCTQGPGMQSHPMPGLSGLSHCRFPPVRDKCAEASTSMPHEACVLHLCGCCLTLLPLLEAQRLD